MKMKIKALVAALSMGAAVQANAAINDDGALNAQSTGTGAGELFLSVIDRGGASPESYVRDLGITANQFVNQDSTGKTASPLSFTADANMAQLLADTAANGGSLFWQISAADDQDPSSGLPFGVLVTSPNTVTTANAPQGFSGVASAMTLLGQYAHSVNQAEGTSSTAANLSGVFGSSSPAFYDNGAFGANWPNPTLVETGIGNAMGMYFIGWDPNNLNSGNDDTLVSAIGGGVWTLGANGDLTFGQPAAVPLPPAVWLLGSALVGLVGVGRRRDGASAA